MTTSETCPVCGELLIVKEGKHGRFLSCSMFPTCSYSRSLKAMGPTLPDLLPGWEDDWQPSPRPGPPISPVCECGRAFVDAWEESRHRLGKHGYHSWTAEDGRRQAETFFSSLRDAA